MINEFIKTIITWGARMFLLVAGGTLIGHSFSAPNSFSAEFMFTLGSLMAIGGFYIE